MHSAVRKMAVVVAVVVLVDVAVDEADVVTDDVALVV